MSYEDNTKYEFIFSVPCYMNYTIVAESEKEARTILEDGGIEIDGEYFECPDGDLSLEPEDYGDAELIEQLEI
jgi:hypothetical protein|tara:strand:- start:4 stop:222 length:219 start_codon:yes stop_codon:yes gene_type:complete